MRNFKKSKGALLIALLVLTPRLLFPAYYRGEFNGWNNSAMSSSLGIVRFTTNCTANDNPSEFKIDRDGDWSVNWGSGNLAMGLNTKYTMYQSGANSGFNAVSGQYYTFAMRDVTGGGSVAAVLRTSASPVSVAAVTDDSSGSVVLTNRVRVRITLGGAKCSEERIYCRYSSDGWSSDGFIPAAASNTTVYTCQIPAQNKICSVSYYILTATTNWSLGNDLDYYPDLMTLRYNNNGGLNYSYTVRGIRTIDGNPADWTGAPSSLTNSAAVSSGEWIWSDADNDVRKNLSLYAGGTNNYELEELRITSDSQYLYFLIRMKDLTGSGYPYVTVAVDTNRIGGSGQEWLGDFSDTKVATNTFWERQLVLPVGAVRFYKPDWSSFTRGLKTNSIASNCIEAAISWSNLGITNGGNYRFAVMVAQDSNGYTIDRYGSDAMDAVTGFPGETWNEVGESSSDGRIDFYFDIDFSKTGGVQPDNNAPSAVSTIDPKNVKVSTYYPVFRWSRPSDADGDSITAYLFQVSEYSNFSVSQEFSCVTRTNHTLSSGLLDNKIYYWRVAAYDSHARRGPWSTVTSFTSPRSFKTIDGEESDWYGVPPSQPGVAVISSNEWIWKDKTGDRRGDADPDNLGNYDLAETRVTFDSNAVYFLFKFQDINDITKPYIAVLFSTNQSGGMNWIADDSGVLVGGDYGKAPASSHYGLYNLIIHDAGTGVTKIEIFSNSGSIWYAPPTDGSDACFINPTDNIIEAKVARQDLRIKGDKIVRMSFILCKNASPPLWANSGDSTYAYATCDAVDTVSLPRMLTNDKYNDKSAWEEDISDGDIDFWAELKVKKNGAITNIAPAPSSGPSPADGATNVALNPSLKWRKVTDLDDLVASYLVELSSVTNLSGTVLLRVNLTNTNYSLPFALPDGLTYYWRVRARDRRGILSTNVPLWSFQTVATQQIGQATTPPFTPSLDGVKDSGWGSTPYANSPQSNLPVNYADDLYVSNDPDYLYIGWRMRKDPWDESGSGYDKSSHYGFVFEAKNDPFGGTDDPFVSGGTTKISWLMKPDIWIEGWIKTGFTDFGKLIKYLWDEPAASWSESYLEAKKDYGIKTNSWGEFRIPLKELDAVLGDKVSILRYFRPAEDKPGVSDSVPYDTSCNDYADSASTLTIRSLYRIQYSVVQTWHYPDHEEVPGLGRMRNPVSPASSDRVALTIGVYPYDGYDSAFVYYTTNNWAVTNQSAFSVYHRSANNMYLKSEIGPFPKGKVVRYFTRVTRNGMSTYNYGSDAFSTVTSNKQTAQQNAYAFLSGNSAPLTPSVSLAPVYLFTNEKLTALVSSATDLDNDPLVCYFQWYKNGRRQTNLNAIDDTPPFSSSVSNLKAGDFWHCTASLYDSYQFSGSAVSPDVPVLFCSWLEGISLPTNSSLMTNGEFIWLDRQDDVRDDVAMNNPGNFDLVEFHLKKDSEYLCFLFRFREIIEDYRIGLALSVNTNQSSGEATIGDETGLTLGSNYSGSYASRLANAHLLFHSAMIGSPVIEMKRENDADWSVLSATNGFFRIHKEAGFAEGRIRRSLLNLGNGKTARMSLVVFKDYVGLANEIDASCDFPGNDGLDALSAGLSDGSSLVNYASMGSSWEEELSDNALDFWFDANMDFTNTPPLPVTGLSPTNNAIITDLTPALSWSNLTGADITGYYLEFGLYTNNLLYRVNVKSNGFQVPVNLSEGYTNYSWRVFGRNRTGALSKNASWRKFRVGISAPSAGLVQDHLNRDNYNNYSGLESASSSVVFNWAPSLDPSGISNYYLSIGTTPGGSEITNSMRLPRTRTVYTAFNLPRGSTYYARLRAENKLNVTGDYGPESDGIFVSRIAIDSNISDWADKSAPANSTAVSNGTGIWQDALLDARNSTTNLDLEKFKVALDQYNLYLYFKFTSARPWADGQHFIQVAVDNDPSSSTRPFIGRGISSADLFVSSEARWEYLIKLISGSGFESCTACDRNFSRWKTGAYRDNATERSIECAVPLSALGGAERFLNRRINLSVAIFKNNAGSVAAIDGDSTPDALDAVATNSGPAGTWNALSDQVLDYYLECGSDSCGLVNYFSGRSVMYTEPPSYPSVGASSAGWIQNAIIYFLFVDRFYNGDPSNDVTGSTKRKGGDFKGILDNMDYLRNLNVNCVYMAPPMKFGDGGAAGYNTYDWWNVDTHFGTDADFHDLVQTFRQNGIDLIIDWPGTAIGGGPVADNNPNWSKLYKSPWGGWPEWTCGMAEVQQYFSDALTHWASKGVRGFRLDYAKFDGNPVDHGHQYWQYVRGRLKAVFPDRYMFGEIFDTAYKISTYTWSGNELDGAFDFPLEEYGSGGIIKWGIQQSIDSGSFWNEIQNAENTYGNNPVMVSFIDNHDKDRALRRAGGDSWKVRLSLGFSLTWHEPTSLFYGTEMGMDGWRDGNDLDNSPCIEKMWGLNPDVTPWWGGYSYAQHNFIKRLLAGKRSFPGLRSGRIGINMRYASGQWLIYERNFYNDAVLVVLNRSSSGAWAPTGNFATWASRSWRDWMNGSDYFSTGSDGKFSPGIWVEGNDCRVLVSREYGSGGYGECSVSGTVNVPEAVIRVKDYAGTVYERVARADGNGNYYLNNIVCLDTGNENKVIEAWAPGYAVSYLNQTVWDSGAHDLDITLIPDSAPPESPKGITVRPGDGITELVWSKNTEDDFGSYIVYRSQTESGEYTRIGEVLDSAYLDNTVENGKTYYYKVRSRDINGNASGFSRTVGCAAGPIDVTFWLNVRSSGYGTVQKVLIRGNSEKMNFWGIINSDPEMTEEGNGWYSITFKMDPRMGVMYKYKLLENGNWHEEQSFSGSGSWYGNRYVDLSDQGNGRMDLYNSWNLLGDAPPVKPENLSVSPGNQQVSLSWDKNTESDIRYYSVLRRIGLVGSFSNIANVSPLFNTFMDKSVVNGTTYYYFLNATDENSQTGADSKTNAAIPLAGDTAPPSRPSGLSLTALSTNRIHISWRANNEPDLSGYNVNRSNAGFSWTKINTALIAPSASPSFTNTVSPGIEYFYRVNAVDDSTNANVSSNSSVVSGRLIRASFTVDMGEISPDSVKITGPGSPFAQSGLALAKISDCTWSVRTGVLDSGTVQYRYMYNGNMLEDDFSFWHGNRELVPAATNGTELDISDDWEEQPGIPQNVWAFPKDGAVEVHWDSVSGSEDLAGYNVYYSTNLGGRFENRVNESVHTGNSLTVSGLINNRTYYFIVRSVDGGDIRLESPDSSVVRAVPKKSVPVYFRTMNSVPEKKTGLVLRKEGWILRLY